MLYTAVEEVSIMETYWRLCYTEITVKLLLPFFETMRALAGKFGKHTLF